MSARDLTASGFLSALDRAAEAIRARPHEPVSELYAASVARMVREPWRIDRAVYGTSIWPSWEGATPAEVLVDCRARIAAAKGMAGHWTYDANRLVALNQAEAALLRMIEGER